MLSRRDAQEHLKELKKELKHWHKMSRHNPWPYVQEYIGVLERRIAAYEKIMPHTIELQYIKPVPEVKAVEHWGM